MSVYVYMRREERREWVRERKREREREWREILRKDGGVTCDEIN